MAEIIQFSPAAQTGNIRFAIVAEGYTQAERELFLSHVANAVKGMFSGNGVWNDPFYRYKNYFDIQAVFSPTAKSSNTSSSDPSDTLFDTQISDRLIVGSQWKVEQYLAGVYGGDMPDMMLVLVNTNRYGGAGLTTAFASGGNSETIRILLHEIGHAYAGLADEYSDPSIADTFELQYIRDSVHVTADPDNLPWQHWVGFEDALGTVGRFEGGYYRETGVWRATADSMMNSMEVSFNAPQKEKFALNFYRDMGDYASLARPIAGIAAAIVPARTNVAYDWSVDGAAAGGGRTPYLDLLDALPLTAAGKVSLGTVDATGLIRKGLDSTRDSVSIDVAADQVSMASTSSNFTVVNDHLVYRLGSGVHEVQFDAGADGVYLDGTTGRQTLKLAQDFKLVELIPLASGAFVAERAGVPQFALKAIETVVFDDATLWLDTAANRIDGGAGVDVLWRTGAAADYTLAYDAATQRYLVTDTVATRDASVSVGAIELIHFSDKTVRLDPAASSAGAVLSVSASTDAIDDGGAVTFVVKTSNFSEGHILRYAISGLGAADMVGGAHTGITTVGPGGTALVHLQVRDDISGEGDKTLTLGVFSGTEETRGSVLVRDLPGPPPAPTAPVPPSPAADDLFIGGEGVETVYYPAARNAFTIVRNGDDLRVTSAAFGTDTLRGIERIDFADATVAYDVDGIAGQAYRLYQAAFHRTPDTEGLGFWIAMMDQGVSLATVAGGFAASKEFATLYSGANNRAIVDKFYQNTLGRAGDPDGIDFWVGKLDAKEITVSDLLMGFSESAENQAALIGSIGNGIVYDLYA